MCRNNNTNSDESDPCDQHDTASQGLSPTVIRNDDDDAEDMSEREQRLRYRRHFWSTIGLCGSAFSMFFLIMNVFPYSGFMALHLLNGSDKDPSSSSTSSSSLYYTAATIGPYAGILASSFRLGRIPTAIPWGQCADVYGRRFALIVGLVAMVVGNILFGLAPTYAWAVAIRFVNGILNGTMVVARTSITEIAHGDPKLEARGVAMMSSMSGYGMLIGPAIGGLLSEPVRQHPGWFRDNHNNESGTKVVGRKFLEEYPFVLPNLVGSLVAFLSLVIVVACVEETLPEDQRRDWRCFPGDALRWIEENLRWRERISCFCKRNTINNDGMQLSSNRVGSVASEHGTANASTSSSSSSSSSPTAATTTTTTTMSTNENTPLVPPTTQHSERTLVLPLYSTQGLLDTTENTVETRGETSGGVVGLFLNTPSTVRYYFYSMWCYAFTSLASSEAFPLFAMTSITKGGLGLDEANIGIVQTIAGSVFVLGQYSVFMFVKKRVGVLEAVRIGAFYSNFLRILIPLGLYFSSTSGSDHNWYQLGYLGLVAGVAEIFGSIFMGCATIGSNARIEHPSQRASMNGLLSMVASLGRGIGPIVSGYLVAWTMASETISSQLSGWVVYGVLLLAGMVTYVSTMAIPNESKR